MGCRNDAAPESERQAHRSTRTTEGSRYDPRSHLLRYCLYSCSSAGVTVWGRVHKQLLWETELFRELAIETLSDQRTAVQKMLGYSSISLFMETLNE